MIFVNFQEHTSILKAYKPSFDLVSNNTQDKETGSGENTFQPLRAYKDSDWHTEGHERMSAVD